MTMLKKNMLEFMRFEFATQNIEVVHRCNVSNAIYEWKRKIKNKEFHWAIGSVRCVGSWSDTPQGHGYWSYIYLKLEP